MIQSSVYSVPLQYFWMAILCIIMYMAGYYEHHGGESHVPVLFGSAQKLATKKL
jgi:hypothetical protein